MQHKLAVASILLLSLLAVGTVAAIQLHAGTQTQSSLGSGAQSGGNAGGQAQSGGSLLVNGTQGQHIYTGDDGAETGNDTGLDP